ncbi:MAG: prepilin-type N-terminal cleavage/methylation domain-containing protein, partial [Candidatus Omnitrophica bacterium]|nr:prepilin-type N-terminal cleavage/methylation domain-containing protein [Candidatus Omnitrophota bacterium]
MELLKKKIGLTLLELLIAITLVGLISLGIWSISTFSYYYLINSDRLAKIQNELAYIVDHISKLITGPMEIVQEDGTWQGRGGAIGTVDDPPLKVEHYGGKGWFLKIRLDQEPFGVVGSEDPWVGY